MVSHSLEFDFNIENKTETQLKLISEIALLGNLVSQSEKNWLDLEAAKPDFDEEKIRFYLWAAEERRNIVNNSPTEKKDEIFKLVTNILNQSSDGRRKIEKKIPIERIKNALLKFKKVQQEVNDRTLKIKQLPAGFEKQIWERFMERFEKETPGNIWNLDLINNFEKSVKTTFTHLAKVLDMQETIKKKIEKEKAFQLQDVVSKNTIQETLTEIVNSRLIEWTNNTDFHLKKWSEEFNNIINKQTPAQLKEFNTYYSQAFDKDFWKTIPQMHPQDFPNLTGTFNFLEENYFYKDLNVQINSKYFKESKQKTLIKVKKEFKNYFEKEIFELEYHHINELVEFVKKHLTMIEIIDEKLKDKVKELLSDEIESL